MGACCGKKEKVKAKGKGVQIGGSANQKVDNQVLADAAERRMQQGQSRGLTQQGQMNYQLKQQKLEEAERYEQDKKQNNEEYALKWK